MPLPGRRQGRAPATYREELNWTLFPPELSRPREPLTASWLHSHAGHRREKGEASPYGEASP